MSENEYTKYSYNPYQQSGQQPAAGRPEEFQFAPMPEEEPESFDKPASFGAGLIQKIQANPLVATVSLLAVGAAFAGIIAFGSSGDAPGDNIPVIQAETTAFKTQPDDAGGMDIPNDDSTIFAVMREDAFEPGPGKEIRNLLDPASTEKPVGDKLASFDEETEALMLDSESDKKPSFTKTAALGETEPPQLIKPVESTATVTGNKIELAPAVEKVPAQPATDLIREANTQKPESIHAAGSSPETLAYVRSVLDQKEASAVSGIEPAAGGDTSKISGTSTGEYYIQLASVTSPAGADKEWGKLKKSLTGLESLSYRVQEANLGARGTFYRIQAGPLSKESAMTLCDSIKAQKPGGCLVVK